MKDRLSKILLNPIFIVSFLVWIYVLIPFIAPVAYKYGNSDLGWRINQIYENFCHQRVERAIFLFGENSIASFYTVSELKEQKVIPEVNPNPEGYTWPEYFGHDYVGNNEVGYKVPLCIRDIALYGSIALTLTLLSILSTRVKEKIKRWKVTSVSLLLIPMAADGVFQSIVEMLQLKHFPEWYISSNLKRVVTGLLFGIGIGIITYILLYSTPEKSLTKPYKKGKMKV